MPGILQSVRNTPLVRTLGREYKNHRERTFERRWCASATEEFARNRERLEALRDKHQGRRAVVIGNGPSLNKMDLERLNGELTFGCNSFFLAYDRISWRPDYYTVEDRLPAQDNAKEINAIAAPSTKLIPYDLRHLFDQTDNTVFFNFRRFYANSASDAFPRYSFDVVDRVYFGGTVLFMNIQLAAHLGCNPIVLIGVDLTYQIPKPTEQEGTVLTSKVDDPNHFHPDYFGVGKRWHLPRVDRMQRSFSRAYHALESRQLQLQNATMGGNLQEIPRIDFNSQFTGSPSQ